MASKSDGVVLVLADTPERQYIKGIPPVPLLVTDPELAAYLQATGAYVIGEADDPRPFTLDLQDHVRSRGESWPPSHG